LGTTSRVRHNTCGIILKHGMRPARLFAVVSMVSLAGLSTASHAAIVSPPSVAVFETPAQGIQPHAVVDAKGAIHLVYFKGEPGGGDIYYEQLSVRSGRMKREDAAVRVNSI